MGFFDGQMNFTDPNTLALLGATGALGQASMPSRLPIPTGAILAQAAGAMGPAGSAAYKNQLEQQQALAAGLSNAQSRGQADLVRDKFGLPSLTNEQIMSGKIPGGFWGMNSPAAAAAPPPPTPLNAAPANIVAPNAAPAAPAPQAAISDDTALPNSTTRVGDTATADPAILGSVVSTAKARNVSDAALQGLVAGGVAEGGFAAPWAQSNVPSKNSPNGREQSFGPWQLHQGGELDPYLAAGNKPGDVAANTNYVLDSLEQLHPGFSQITDPKQAAGIMAQFERSVQGPSYYQAHLPAAQKLLASLTPPTDAGTQTAQASPPVAVGDSIAWGLAKNGGLAGSPADHQNGVKQGQFVGANTASVGATPSQILAQIGKIPDEGVKGQNVVLSTGASNDPTQVALAKDQITALYAKGAAHVTVMGVGTKPEIAPANDQLATIAQANNATFSPLTNLSSDGIHPANYQQLAASLPGQQGQLAQAAPRTITDMPQTAVGGTNSPGVSAPAGGPGNQAPALPPAKPMPQMTQATAGPALQQAQNLPVDFRTQMVNSIMRSIQGLKPTPIDDYLFMASQFPAGSPQQRLYLQGATHAAGIEPFIGGQRPGVPGRSYNTGTGNYDIAFQNPSLEKGQMLGPNNQVSLAPGFLGADAATQQQHQAIDNQGKIALAGGLLPSQAAAAQQAADIANRAKYGTLLQPPTPVGGAMAPPNMAPNALSAPASAPGAGPAPAPIAPPTAPALVAPPAPTTPAQQIPLSHNPVPKFEAPADYERWNATQSEAFNKGLADTTDQLKNTYNPQNEKFREQLALTGQIADILPQLEGAMGWGADIKLKASNILTALGVSPEGVQQFTGLDPAAGQELNKMFLQLSAGAVRNMGAREPGSVIALFSHAYPNLETQPGAAKLMINALKMQAQWKVDESAAAGEWGQAQKDNALTNGSQNYRGLDTFKTWFAATHDPHDYWRAAAAISDDPAIAWTGLNDTQRQRVYDLIPPGSVFRADDGKRYPKPAASP